MICKLQAERYLILTWALVDGQKHNINKRHRLLSQHSNRRTEKTYKHNTTIVQQLETNNKLLPLTDYQGQIKLYKTHPNF